MTTALKYEADSIMASDGLRYTFKGGGSPTAWAIASALATKGPAF